MNLGNAIKKVRKEQTQKEFAKAVKISQTFLCEIENNKKNPSPVVLKRISDYTGVPFTIIEWYALEEKDIKPNKLSAYRSVKLNIDALIQEFI
jgi:transcriptional regulator with XRE-family HTH domain